MSMNSYLHILDGRLRIKIPVVKNTLQKAVEVERRIGEIPGVLQARANPTTGNVLVLFDATKTDHFEILGILSREGYLKKQSSDRNSKIGKVVAESLVQSAVQAALERLIVALVV